MAKITFKGGDEYLTKLSRLEKACKQEIIGKAIYEGAKVVTDAIRQELNAIPVSETFVGPQVAHAKMPGPTLAQKEGLEKSLGIATLKDDGTGFLNVKIGFDGYNEKKTEKWPKGQPNQMIARAVESGTSFMRKNQFIKRAVAKSRKKAMAIMKKKVQDGVEKIMK